MVKIGSLTPEIFLIWAIVARTNVAWTNVTMTVGICSRCSQEPTFKVSSNSVTTEILLILSLHAVVGGVIGLVCKIIFKSYPTVTLRLHLSFEKNMDIAVTKHVATVDMTPS